MVEWRGLQKLLATINYYIVKFEIVYISITR